MVKYPTVFTISLLKELSIEELEELEDALWEDRKRVEHVIQYKKFKNAEARWGPFGEIKEEE